MSSNHQIILKQQYFRIGTKRKLWSTIWIWSISQDSRTWNRCLIIMSRVFLKAEQKAIKWIHFWCLHQVLNKLIINSSSLNSTKMKVEANLIHLYKVKTSKEQSTQIWIIQTAITHSALRRRFMYLYIRNCLSEVANTKYKQSMWMTHMQKWSISQNFSVTSVYIIVNKILSNSVTPMTNKSKLSSRQMTISLRNLRRK